MNAIPQNPAPIEQVPMPARSNDALGAFALAVAAMTFAGIVVVSHWH